MAEPTKVTVAKARLAELEREKSPFNSVFQLVSEFIMNRKQNFYAEISPGEFLCSELFDNTGYYSKGQLASALIAMMWPGGGRSLRLGPPRGVPDTEEHKKFYENATDQMVHSFDNAKSGFDLSLDEYFGDAVSYGTSGVYSKEGPTYDTPVQYVTWNIKAMYIAENSVGVVDTVYKKAKYTVRQLIQEYGEENVSAEVRQKFNEGVNWSDEIDVVHVIEPRLKRNPKKNNNKNMPWMSLHFEVKSGKILRESGYEEMPVAVCRFEKVVGEVYGRSPGMTALPDIIELNSLWEFVTVGAEKTLDPTLLVLDDGRLGGGHIDTSAGGLIVYNSNGRMDNTPPVQPLYTVGSFDGVEMLITKLVDSITQAFYIDRLLDLNNETTMTAYETSVRNSLRGMSSQGLFTRQIKELFIPLIERTFNLNFKKGLMGVIHGSKEEAQLLDAGIEPIYIPDMIAQRMIQGLEVYNVEFITPAQRLMQSEELKGIMTSFDFATSHRDVAPQGIDNFDVDEIFRDVHELSGASSKTLNSMQTVEEIRRMRQAAEERAEALEQAKVASEAAMNVSQAESTKNNIV